MRSHEDGWGKLFDNLDRALEAVRETSGDERDRETGDRSGGGVGPLADSGGRAAF